MKRLILMFLVFGVAYFFSSCSKDNTATDFGQNDQLTNSLKVTNLKFAGESNPVAILDPGTTTVLPNGNILIEGLVAEWYDQADTWQVTGQSIWYESWEIFKNGKKIKIWGTADINVNDPDFGTGTWKLNWHGWVTDYTMDADGNLTSGLIAVVANGHGKSGVVEGMVANWKYSMDISDGFTYYFTGHLKTN